SIMASLVKGVYVLEDDRQKKRQGHRAVAPPWWKFFDFQLQEELIDDDASIFADFSTFGAVYEFKPKSNNYYPIGAPRYVIAFRGTMLKKDTILRDTILNINILINKLSIGVSVSDIWLAGHSLGAAIAMLVGRNMAQNGNFLGSYFFNPPFFATPMKRRIYVATIWFKAALTFIIKDKEEMQLSENLFYGLCKWEPKLFLHKSDLICAGFIPHFEVSESMESYGVGEVGRLASQSSFMRLLTYAFGMEDYSEELHLLPSACLTTSFTSKRKAQSLSQWFTDESVSDSKVYSMESEHYRRCIAASLVKGVYVMEDDRQTKRQGCKALAPPWWEFFDFQLLDKLVDEVDWSIFGAVFEFKPKSNNYDYPKGAPRYVIAFRGTVLTEDTAVRDILLDINVFINNLHHRSRSGKAMQAVEKLVSVSGASNVWLAGHSLGSAIAMLAGKKMAKTGNFLVSYLFNPPFVAFLFENFGSRTVKHGIDLASRLLTHANKDNQEKQPPEHLCKDLSRWVPNMFLHPADVICSGFIKYFELREKMRSSGCIERFAIPNSLKGLLVNAFGKEYYSEELHLIFSARVTTSRSILTHGLCQWFTDDSVSETKVYYYK
ncbi:hypothetical protein MKX03_013757, partial [Papaver bracteatum]